jgi:hypothetical protein
MSSHVGTVIVGGFPPEKKATAEELRRQHSSSIVDPNFPFEQGKPWCMPIISYHRVLYILCLQMYCAVTYSINNSTTCWKSWHEEIYHPRSVHGSGILAAGILEVFVITNTPKKESSSMGKEVETVK